MEFDLNGIRLEVPKHITTPKVIARLKSGDYENSEARAAKARVKPGDRVLELGTGLGYVAMICAKEAGPENVVCVEANPGQIPVIENNFALNELDGITLLHGAVTDGPDTPETAKFHVGPAFWGSSLSGVQDHDKGIIEVPVLRMSHLLDIYRPNVVIIDIEGAEQHLFNTIWPRHVRIVMLELHPKKYHRDVIKKIVDCMSASGLTYDPLSSSHANLGFARVF